MCAHSVLAHGHVHTLMAFAAATSPRLAWRAWTQRSWSCINRQGMGMQPAIAARMQMLQAKRVPPIPTQVRAADESVRKLRREVPGELFASMQQDLRSFRPAGAQLQHPTPSTDTTTGVAGTGGRARARGRDRRSLYYVQACMMQTSVLQAVLACGTVFVHPKSCTLLLGPFQEPVKEGAAADLQQEEGAPATGSSVPEAAAETADEAVPPPECWAQLGDVTNKVPSLM